jgi:hypothetical protein
MSTRSRLGALTGAAVLTVGLGAVAVTARPAVASTQTCTPTSCGTTAAVTMTSGHFGLLPPAALDWGSNALTGVTQTFYDTALGPLGTGAEAFEVDDLRGNLSGNTAGWHVTATATPFTGTVTGKVIPDGGNLLTIGGGATPTNAPNAPGSICETTGQCVVAANSVTGYPIDVPTGGVATMVYDAAAGTGLGQIQVGTTDTQAAAEPVVWAVTLPSTVRADTYTSTITMTLTAAP